MNIRLPSITGINDSQKLVSIQEYLYELANQLNYALLDMERNKAEGNVSSAVVINGTSSDKAPTTPEDLFAVLKPFIIKNADIISSYSEEINKKLSGEYVAATDFATYTEKTDAEIAANSTNITQYYKNIQQIEGSFSPGQETAIVKTTNATITTGLIDYDSEDNAIYGMEISTVTNGTKFASARFLATGVVVYDERGNEALVITDNTIIAKNIKISTSISVGGMITTVSGAKITGKYVG